MVWRNGWRLVIQACSGQRCCFPWDCQKVLMLLHGVFHLKGRTVLSHFQVVICQIKLLCNIVDELSRIYSLIYFVKCHASFEVLDIICFFCPFSPEIVNYIIIAKSKMYGWSLNLSWGIIEGSELSKCIFRSPNLSSGVIQFQNCHSAEQVRAHLDLDCILRVWDLDDT